MMTTRQETLILASSISGQDSLSLFHLDLHPKKNHVAKPRQEQNRWLKEAWYSSQQQQSIIKSTSGSKARCGDARRDAVIHGQGTRQKRHTTGGEQSRADARPAQSSAAQTKDDERRRRRHSWRTTPTNGGETQCL
ncbi:uncharacterized protein DS421_14g476140 [Arachis hypogaea]|nr:uncharacterized protein DS421_14g476140 [Arachis hypogaea]